jgi:hypothetical protein
MGRNIKPKAKGPHHQLQKFRNEDLFDFHKSLFFNWYIVIAISSIGIYIQNWYLAMTNSSIGMVISNWYILKPS